MKNKTLSTWLALAGGPLGLHRFYLFGPLDVIGWALPIPTALGLYGIMRPLGLGLDDRVGGVALLVGGIGVMAIMTVSVTSRTREIGVRKALGATRRDILLQFLVEASTLTGIGGVIGILVGLALGRVASVALDVDAPVPVTLTMIAVAVSVAIGIIFGMVPAQRASRLDPIEALRHE